MVACTLVAADKVEAVAGRLVSAGCRVLLACTVIGMMDPDTKDPDTMNLDMMGTRTGRIGKDPVGMMYTPFGTCTRAAAGMTGIQADMIGSPACRADIPVVGRTDNRVCTTGILAAQAGRMDKHLADRMDSQAGSLACMVPAGRLDIPAVGTLACRSRAGRMDTQADNPAGRLVSRSIVVHTWLEPCKRLEHLHQHDKHRSNSQIPSFQFCMPSCIHVHNLVSGHKRVEHNLVRTR